MTELILKNRVSQRKLDSIVFFLRTWGVDAEIKTAATKKIEDTNELFAESFGMWADRDIDIKEIRKNTYKRRTKYRYCILTKPYPKWR